MMISEKKRDLETDYPVSGDYDLDVSPAGAEQGVHDAVFGEIGEDGPNYRAVGKWGALILMTKANLGLGVLALPSIFGAVGLVPGILLILVVQTFIAYAAHAIGNFKLNHPEVYSLPEAAYVVAGRIGKEFYFLFYTIFMVFIIGSACVGISTGLNAVSDHGTCTAVFIAVAAIAGFLLGSIRTLGKISWIGWAGIVSIMAAILTLTIAVGVQDRPYLAPPAPEPWDKELKIFATPTFAGAMSAINGIVFSYGATPMYFGIVTEMKDPRQFSRMMVISIIFLTVVYLIIGSIVYTYCGTFVATPALGSAGSVMKKVCYGIAIPGLLASLTLFTHLCGKHIFVRVMKGSRHITANTPTHWIVWLSCTFGSVFMGYVIASAIPIFGSLIGFIGALICPMVCIIPYTVMWWHDNWRGRSSSERNGRTRLHFYLNILTLAVGIFLLAAGTYGSVVDLIKETSDAKPWTCNDNSGLKPT